MDKTLQMLADMAALKVPARCTITDTEQQISVTIEINDDRKNPLKHIITPEQGQNTEDLMMELQKQSSAILPHTVICRIGHNLLIDKVQ